MDLPNDRREEIPQFDFRQLGTCLEIVRRTTWLQQAGPEDLPGQLLTLQKLCHPMVCLEVYHVSKMAWLSAWSFLLNSCAFGSPHKKPFRLLGWGLDMEMLKVPCPGGHQHVQIAGKLTKPSAVYQPGVAEIAQCFAAALRDEGHAPQPPSTSLESVLINNLLL